MRFSLFIGKRLSFKEDESSTSSPGVVIAVSGIALAIVIMMIAVTVVTGFKNEIAEKVMGFESQITIIPTLANQNSGISNEGIELSDDLLGIITDNAPAAKASLSLRQPGILKTDESFQGMIFKGFSDSESFRFISDNLVEGAIPDYSAPENRNSILISKSTARDLKLHPGDKIFAHFFLNDVIKSRNLTVSGIYDTHFSEYDKRLAFSHISMLQRVCSVDSTVGNAVEINGIPQKVDIDEIADNIRSDAWKYVSSHRPDYIYNVESVHQTGALYFNWLELLDTNVVVILILMALVSGFTLISSLFIIILERIRTIGLLKSLGADNATIREIFIFIAQRLVLRGLIIGNIIGIGLLLIQKRFHLVPLDPDAYYLNYVPVDINWLYIAAINVGVIIVSSLVLILPTQIITTISPAKSIRYE